jgi:hypothetical protein
MEAARLVLLLLWLLPAAVVVADGSLLAERRRPLYDDVLNETPHDKI